MSVPKVVGIEQEYAISVKGRGDLSPFHASCFLVNALARDLGLRDDGVKMLWDYGHETPYHDIRGELFRKVVGQEIVSESENLRINVALPNGARFYTDHAHPEYSTPECISARDVVACDKAGEVILRRAIQLAHSAVPDMQITLFKNNVDYQGHSYGSHENYLMDRQAHEDHLVRNPEKIVSTLVPFLVTRQIFAGAGKVGSEAPETRDSSYQVSQRADYMEAVFGLETMYARPIINTRQEHHADERRFRRLHLILGDANMCECAAFLKIGSTQIVLQMIEDAFLDEDLSLRDPVKSLKQVSADFRSRLDLADGRSLEPLEVQRKYLEKAQQFSLRKDVDHVPGIAKILDVWGSVLEGLQHLRITTDFAIDEDPLDVVPKLDWLLKLWLLNRYREGKGGKWDLPALRVLDLQYHNVSGVSGIFKQLESEGLSERILNDADIDRFISTPPPDTRAYFRGKCVERFPREVYLINWEVVGFDHGNVNRLIPLLDPLSGTQNHVEDLFEDCENSKELIKSIQSRARAR